jgi:hypothetical protein
LQSWRRPNKKVEVLTIVMREIQLKMAAEAWLNPASRRSAEWEVFFD